jgi:hypothetical protein
MENGEGATRAGGHHGLRRIILNELSAELDLLGSRTGDLRVWMLPFWRIRCRVERVWMSD